MESVPNRYKCIVLTGGPCGGKTSAVSILSELFESFGYTVYRVPETATVLFSGGVHFPDLDKEMAYSFQKSILKTMLEIEQTFRNLAKIQAQKGKKVILICDRGALDPSAYMERELWLKMLRELELDEIFLRDHRYDAIFHLMSAAKGAESFYHLENNATRTEGLEFAKFIDASCMNAWLGHQYFQVIDNSGEGGFTEKMDRLVQAVSIRLGLVHDKNRYGNNIKKMKFLVKDYNPDNFPVPFREFNVEHQYLIGHDGVQSRIRKRSEKGTNALHFTLTTRKVDNGQRIELRRNISPREFNSYQIQTDPGRLAVKKLRRCFLYNDRYYQLDVFQSPREGLVLLEGYLDSNDTNVPDWLECQNVTDLGEYSMYNISEIEASKPSYRPKDTANIITMNNPKYIVTFVKDKSATISLCIHLQHNKAIITTDDNEEIVQN